MTTSIGIDVGSGVIKTALFRVEGEKNEWVSRWDARIMVSRSIPPSDILWGAFRHEKLKARGKVKEVQ